MDIKVIRSRRKTLSMTLKPEGLIVRAPLWATKREIQKFIDAHQAWLKKALARQEQRQRELEDIPPLTEEELGKLAEQARAYLPERVSYYAPKVGVTYGRITIRTQKFRWGSCSAKGNLNFNCLLMLAPPQVIDSVVVHELCHRKVMDHSEKFYQEVLRVFPDYRNCHRWLKDHGDAILYRAAECRGADPGGHCPLRTQGEPLDK